MTRRLGLAALLAASACGSRDVLLATVDQPDASTLAPIELPIEVLGVEPTVTSVEFELAQDADALFLVVHRPGYRNGEDGKASVRLDDQPWTPLSNAAVTVYPLERSYGGIGGGFHTVRMDVPISEVGPGRHRLEFRFEGTDGYTSGFRVVDLQLRGDGEPRLGADARVQVDPEGWAPPLTDPEAARAGELLWTSAALRAAPGAPEGMSATCSDCHASDGRDLQYFAFSNEAIVVRSMFHGLSELEGQRIASYIRGLEVTPHGRPWNPPYQPGPDLDAQPVEAWAAGAGIDAIVDDEAEVLAHLFPDGLDAASIRTVVARDYEVNAREIPLSLQLPDWMAWLPEVHPRDVWPDRFGPSPINAAYLGLDEVLAREGADGLIARGALLDEVSALHGAIHEFLEQGASAPNGNAFDGDSSETLDARRADLSIEDAWRSVVAWSAVKQWELVQRYRLEDRLPEVLPQAEPRGWPMRTRSVSLMAPRITAVNFNHFEHRNRLAGKYETTAWYALQLVLTPGSRQPAQSQPIGWIQLLRHTRELGEESGRWGGARFLLAIAKMYQMRASEEGPGATGWTLSITHPWWYHSSPRGSEALFSPLDELRPGLRRDVVTALLREFLDRVTAYELSSWDRCVPNGRTPHCVEPADYLPTPHDPSTGDVVFSFPERHHADGFYRLLPRLRDLGVDPEVLEALAAWCQTLWPAADWDERWR